MQANVPFDKRLKKINRRHAKMTNGVVRRVNSDGLIIAKPRAFRARFPLKTLIVALTLGFLFKGFVFAYLGEAAYGERLAALQAGGIIEQAGAWIMQPDPATQLIATGVQGVIAE